MVFTIYGRGGHLGHVTHILRSNFHPPYPGMLHIKFHFEAASEKKIFDKCVWMTDPSRSRDDLGLNYNIPSSTPLVVSIYHFSGLRLQ